MDCMRVNLNNLNGGSAERLEYFITLDAALRGWLVPQDKNPKDDGYLVLYPDSPDRNVEGFDGYVSWSTKSEFEKVYRMESFTFGQAMV